MLETKNIYIDTQIFVANNFFASENLIRLADFGAKGLVNIFLTEITIQEIQSNIKEDLLNAQEEINRFKKAIQQKGKILKNIEEFKKYIDTPKLDINVDYDNLKRELDEFLEKGKVQIIPFDLADLNSVIPRYFSHERPFGLGKKKYEFPDAIVLSAIEGWCEKENCQIYLMSGDGDMAVTSERIIHMSSLREMLDNINRQYETDRVRWFEELFNNSQFSVIEKIKEKFKQELEDRISYDAEISQVKVFDVKLFDASIVQDNKGLGEVIFQLDADIHFYADIEYDDYSDGIYDKEEDRWLIYERRVRHVNVSTTQTVEISIEAFYDDKLLNDIDDCDINCTYCSVPDPDEILDKENSY